MQVIFPLALSLRKSFQYIPCSVVSTFIFYFSVFRGPAPLISKAVASTLDVSLSLVISVYIHWCPRCPVAVQPQLLCRSSTISPQWVHKNKSAGPVWKSVSPLCAWEVVQLHVLPACFLVLSLHWCKTCSLIEAIAFTSHPTKQNQERRLPLRQAPSESGRNVPSSSIFGSLQLHSDMESCAGHLQNQTYSHNRAEKKEASGGSSICKLKGSYQRHVSIHHVVDFK